MGKLKITRNPRIPERLHSKHLKPLFANCGFKLSNLRVYRVDDSDTSFFKKPKLVKIASINWHYMGEYFELFMYDKEYTRRLENIIIPLLEKYGFQELKIYDDIEE